LEAQCRPIACTSTVRLTPSTRLMSGYE
jgi:hypothetical protein